MSKYEVIVPGEGVWKPHPGPQEEFMAIPDEIQEAFFGGSVGPGKSWCLLMLPILRGFHLNGAFRGVIFRRTFPQLEEYLIPESKLKYGKVGGTYNDKHHRWTFKSGATISFSYIETPDHARDHDGSQYNFIGWDELTHFDEWVYRYLFRSLRSGTKSLPALVRSTSNPGNIGHTWVRKRFIEPARQGYKKLYDSETKSFRIFIPAKATDNPTLLENNPNYLNILNTLPEAERKAKIDGDWWTFSGQVFTEFREHKYHGEPDHALHVIDPYVIPGYWPKILSIDWGFTHPVAAHWHAISPKGQLITFEEYHNSKTPIGIWGADIGRITRTMDNVKLIVMDPSAWKTESHGKTIAEQFTEASDLLPEKAINDRLAGKQHYHEMLRWREKPAKKLPKEGYSFEKSERLYRMYGEKAQQEYVEMFLPEKPETNLPKWQIFRNCKHLIETIPTLVYDEKKVEDVAKMNGDDDYDETRYGIMAFSKYIQECKEEYELFCKEADIEIKLAQTGDHTAYYRQMEYLEKKREENMVPYNRFQHYRRELKHLRRTS